MWSSPQQSGWRAKNVEEKILQDVENEKPTQNFKGCFGISKIENDTFSISN